MANKSLFKSSRGKIPPKADTVNKAGGRAYKFGPKHALAQLATTGCLSNTYYATDTEQLADVIALRGKVPSEFVAKTAIYSREKGFMKDMPTLLLALLSTDPSLFPKTFHRVVDNMKMLRNFVQVMRSGSTGRKSLGTMPRRLVREALDRYTDGGLFANSVGANPSLPDIIKMVHPKPKTESRKLLYAYLIGKLWDPDSLLPVEVRAFEHFKATGEGDIPKVPFQMLTNLKLTKKHWTEIALFSSWHTLRINLNKFAREGVFNDAGIAESIAHKLKDHDQIKRSKIFPYQLMMAFNMVADNVPKIISDALQDAMDIALMNVPKLEGNIFICPDVSGSMSSAITGRHGSTVSSNVRNIDVAALVAAAFAKMNPNAHIIPYEGDVVNARINTRDSIMTMAQKLANIGGGSTNASAPLRLINAKGINVDTIIYISDSESWLDSRNPYGDATPTMMEWEKIKQRNPKAKMICIDLVPNMTTQAPDRSDILNIGGFSDRVFDIVSLFSRDQLGPDHWVGEIEKVSL